MQHLIKLLLIIITIPVVSYGNEIIYFNDEINYWDEHKKNSKVSPIAKSSKEVSLKKDDSKFKWSKYLDPKNDEFFKEGNYTPPKPFMELARDPSDKNISNWIKYNDKKNNLNKRLQTRMKQYLIRNSLLTAKTESIISKQSSTKAQKFDPSRYRVRMYFDSKCPHCKRMFNTLAELQSNGVFVEALQIDDGTFKKANYPVPIRRADRSEIKKYNIKSVPFTLVADLKKKALYPPIKGYQSFNAFSSILKKGETQ